jgi:hypothetical protein
MMRQELLGAHSRLLHSAVMLAVLSTSQPAPVPLECAASDPGVSWHGPVCQGVLPVKTPRPPEWLFPQDRVGGCAESGCGAVRLVGGDVPQANGGGGAAQLVCCTSQCCGGQPLPKQRPSCGGVPILPVLRRRRTGPAEEEPVDIRSRCLELMPNTTLRCDPRTIDAPGSCFRPVDPSWCCGTGGQCSSHVYDGTFSQCDRSSSSPPSPPPPPPPSGSGCGAGFPNASLPYPDTSTCWNVSFAGAWAAGPMYAKVVMWDEGIRMASNYVNKRGGLRLGQGNVGRVSANFVQLDAVSAGDIYSQYRDTYESLCNDNRTHVLLAPADRDMIPDVLNHLYGNAPGIGCNPKQQRCMAPACSKPILVSEPELEIERYPWAYTVYSNDSQWGRAVDFLFGMNDTVNTVAIAGKLNDLNVAAVNTLKSRIKRNKGRLSNNCNADPTNFGHPRCLQVATDAVGIGMRIEGALNTKPDVFIGLGDIDTFQLMLEKFSAKKYTPKAAFLISGLALTPKIEKESYANKNCEECNLVYNQWMGTMPWTVDMQHDGPRSWVPGLPDPFNETWRSDNPQGDNGWSRYMGGARHFASLADSWLKECNVGKQQGISCNGHSAKPKHVSYVHAKAAASLLTLQMALELSSEGQGYGLPLSEWQNYQKVNAAMAALDVHTFWGPIKLHDTEGWNTEFKMSEAQFDSETATMPQLVTSEHPAVYPAQWPCEVRPPSEQDRQAGRKDACPAQQPGGTEACGGVCIAMITTGAVLFCCGGMWVQRRRYARDSRDKPEPSPLRATLLGGEDFLPAVVLADRAVDAVWATAQQSAPDTPGKSSGTGHTDANNDVVPMRAARHQQGGSATVAVMFRDAQLKQLRPPNWKQQVLGKGAYGTVYGLASIVCFIFYLCMSRCVPCVIMFHV